MRILVVGSGGREHALTRALATSSRTDALYAAPGNPGTAQLASNVGIASDDIDGLVDFAQEDDIDLTIVGPEKPLVDGIVDAFQEAGLPIVGPTAAAAQLEGSKAFADQFMARHDIPTAEFEVFTVGFPERDREVRETQDTLREQDIYSSVSDGQRRRVAPDHPIGVR